MNTLEQLLRFLMPRAGAPGADVPQNNAPRAGTARKLTQEQRPKRWQLLNQAIYGVKHSVSSPSLLNVHTHLMLNLAVTG
jgi:hypothetical protein